MKILITGATGLVGKKLIKELLFQGYLDLNILTRNKSKGSSTFGNSVKSFEWNVESNFIEPEALNNVDIIVHLAGENIADGRWTEKRKKEILDSRTKSTKLLLEEIQKKPTHPKKFISSSAVGIYGETKDHFADTENTRGDDFLSFVCQEWEKNLLNSPIKDMEKICFRTGVVLSKDGGALVKMLPPFYLGAGGVIGSGKQYMSWIHIDDLIAQIIFLIKGQTTKSIYNAVAPKAVTNYEFTKTLGKVIHRPTIIPIPRFGLKILFGEMSEMLLSGQRVQPKEFLEAGFVFKYPTLDEALKNLLT